MKQYVVYFFIKANRMEYLADVVVEAPTAKAACALCEAKFALLRRIDAARTDLSTPKARENFNACLSKHGRAVVAVCVAATLDARKDRLDCWNWVWAYEVLSALPQSITLRNLERAHIEDGLHPTAICDYAGPFIRLTTEE